MIYLIKSNEKLKIGYTNNLSKRLKQYATHNPDIEIVNIKSGDLSDETELHSLFKKYIVKGEWYLYSEGIIEEFERYLPLNIRPVEVPRLTENSIEVYEDDSEEDDSVSLEDHVNRIIAENTHYDYVKIVLDKRILYHRIGNKYIKNKNLK